MEAEHHPDGAGDAELRLLAARDGRRAQIAIGADGTVIESEVSLDQALADGDAVGLIIRRARLFPEAPQASNNSGRQ